MATIIVAISLLAAVSFAIAATVRRSRKGGSCCGGSGSSECAGCAGCSGCASRSHCPSVGEKAIEK